MRSDLPGMVRRQLLLSEGNSFRAKENGMRKKKSVRGNTVSQDIVQINMKVIKHSSKPIETLIKKDEKSETDKKEEKEEIVEKKTEYKKEEEQ